MWQCRRRWSPRPIANLTSRCYSIKLRRKSFRYEFDSEHVAGNVNRRATGIVGGHFRHLNCHRNKKMSFLEIVDLCSDDEHEEADMKPIKLKSSGPNGEIQLFKCHEIPQAQNQLSKTHFRTREFEENRDSNALSTGQSNIDMLDQGQSPVDDMSLSSRSPICPTPLCRQFWKAGNYDDELGSKVALNNGKNYLHVHPMFLHSNATSHKWAFGAIAELIDNAVDEIQNGATFVIVDKTSNSRDGSPALLIQDNGGGMGPEAMRCCMSFGFSDKKSKSSIGQYGNGFKTSSMRLGADVIVFSRHLDNGKFTQSAGLLSYTFLRQTGLDRIVVPMVDYEFNSSTSTLEPLLQYGKKHFVTNLSILLQWSPYLTEQELLKQFDDIGYHGTKIVIYNLWFSDDDNMELDFDSDPEDIRLGGDIKEEARIHGQRKVNEQHIANQFHNSLRVYLSILYLRIPQNFNIILLGRVVEYRNIANDLKFQEFVMYRPQNGGLLEGQVLTTIGFLKEAPRVNIHGFNVYHKNRLILPFWKVVNNSSSKGRGVVGVLEANFIQPTHNKQDFERTPLFQKLECRLKEMTWEYWDQHCELIGYHPVKKPEKLASPHSSSNGLPQIVMGKPIVLNQSSAAINNIEVTLSGGAFQHPAATASHDLAGRPGELIIDSRRKSQQGACMKRKEHGCPAEPEMKRHAGIKAIVIDSHSPEMQPVDIIANHSIEQKAITLIQENKKLHAQCLEYEKREKEFHLKTIDLRNQLREVHNEQARLLAELEKLDAVKGEN